MIVWVPLLAAAPGDDPGVLLVDEALRAQAADRILGARATSATELAGRLGEVDAGPWVDLGPEQAYALGKTEWNYTVRPAVHLALGDALPDNQGGDTEPGLVTPFVGLATTASWRFVEARVTPELSVGLIDAACADCLWGGDGGASAGQLRLPTAWIGLQGEQARLGFGKEQRWIGPGRRGTLAWSDNATAPWMGGGAAEGRIPGPLGKIGRFRVEIDLGWLDQPRDDVAHPGFMFWDARWLPVPMVEIGATRMTLFAGEGRPKVDIGQLLIPTEPHIYDDPDKLLPDQNEIARLDARLMLPLGQWFESPVRYAEAWWEYGGEDVIKRYTGPIPYPALAGVANLYGAEVAVGPLVVTGEHARVLDDTFRWYVSHRVYHDGFTQNDRVLGHEAGSDSLSWYLGAAWTTPTLRVSGWTESIERVGVVSAQNGEVFAMSTEELRRRFGAEAAMRLPGAEGSTIAAIGGLRPALSGTLEQVTGQAFIPGADSWQWRVVVSLRTDRAQGWAKE